MEKPPAAVVDEFRAKTLGTHSPDLARLLTQFRGEPMKGKFVLVCTQPYEEWMIGQLSGVRGEPVTMVSQDTYSSRAEAEWDVFRLRWKRYFGEDLPK